jgi:hypothetical protein
MDKLSQIYYSIKDYRNKKSIRIYISNIRNIYKNYNFNKVYYIIS